MSITKFDLGETKYVEIRIFSRENPSFIIGSAQHEVLKKDGTVEQAKTDAIIDGRIISGLITPSKKGEYIVKFYYTIGVETYIYEVRICVE